MGRIRTIKPEFFRSRSLARCPVAARLTFAGLWTEADDHGRGVADPRIIKGALWALEDDVTHQHVSAHLRVLAETGHIRLYEVAGETYYEVANWDRHQAAAYRRGEPKHPAPDGYLDDVSHDDVQESAAGTQESAGREQGREGKGEDDATSSRTRSDRATRLPDGWKPEPEPELIRDLGGDVAARRELEKFRDYWAGVSGAKGRKVDWQATWRNWLRRAGEGKPKTADRSKLIGTGGVA